MQVVDDLEHSSMISVGYNMSAKVLCQTGHVTDSPACRVLVSTVIASCINFTVI
jgi:hypothetical protein